MLFCGGPCVNPTKPVRTAHSLAFAVRDGLSMEKSCHNEKRIDVKQLNNCPFNIYFSFNLNRNTYTNVFCRTQALKRTSSQTTLSQFFNLFDKQKCYDICNLTCELKNVLSNVKMKA